MAPGLLLGHDSVENRDLMWCRSGKYEPSLSLSLSLKILFYIWKYRTTISRLFWVHVSHFYSRVYVSMKFWSANCKNHPFLGLKYVFSPCYMQNFSISKSWNRNYQDCKNEGHTCISPNMNIMNKKRSKIKITKIDISLKNNKNKILIATCQLHIGLLQCFAFSK